MEKGPGRGSFLLSEEQETAEFEKFFYFVKQVRKGSI